MINALADNIQEDTIENVIPAQSRSDVALLAARSDDGKQFSVRCTYNPLLIYHDELSAIQPVSSGSEIRRDVQLGLRESWSLPPIETVPDGLDDDRSIDSVHADHAMQHRRRPKPTTNSHTFHNMKLRRCKVS